jgi:hypothetical protein
VETDRPAGGRWIEVAPERLAGWVGAFAERHGGAEISPKPDGVTFRAPDGAVALCQVPFPPLAASVAGGTGHRLAVQAAGQVAGHAMADRTVAVLLVRLGGYAAGVFTGPGPQLAASKVGSRLVHGRSAAGGTSQHRFARRREKQAAEALGAAADTAVRVFSPYAGKIDAVVLGGDRRAMAGLRPDPRLAPYFALAVERFLTVPDPRLAVLRTAPGLYRAIRIHLSGPA